MILISGEFIDVIVLLIVLGWDLYKIQVGQLTFTVA